MWDLPGPGLELVSPALADGFLSTVPPGKPTVGIFKDCFRKVQYLFFLLTFTSEVVFYNLVCKSSFSERCKIERRDCMSTESTSGIFSPGKNNDEWKGICKLGSH